MLMNWFLVDTFFHIYHNITHQVSAIHFKRFAPKPSSQKNNISPLLHCTPVDFKTLILHGVDYYVLELFQSAKSNCYPDNSETLITIKCILIYKLYLKTSSSGVCWIFLLLVQFWSCYLELCLVITAIINASLRLM